LRKGVEQALKAAIAVAETNYSKLLE